MEIHLGGEDKYCEVDSDRWKWWMLGAHSQESFKSLLILSADILALTKGCTMMKNKKKRFHLVVSVRSRLFRTSPAMVGKPQAWHFLTSNSLIRVERRVKGRGI